MSTLFLKENSWYLGRDIRTALSRIGIKKLSQQSSLLDFFCWSLSSILTSLLKPASCSTFVEAPKTIASVYRIAMEGRIVNLDPSFGKV